MADPGLPKTNSAFRTVFGDEDHVHPILIAGAGPAGTLLAFCLAKLGVHPLIVDSNHFTDHEWGRGDGLLCRSVEVLRSLGVGETIVANGYPIWERVSWDTNTDTPTCATTSDIFPSRLDIEDCFVLGIRQGLVEKILSDEMTAICETKVLRPWTVVDVSIDDPEDETKPLIATLKSQYGEIREVKARYIVGCDGGRSAVRRSLGKYDVKLEGDAHDSVWSAIDIVGFATDFPDIKKFSIITSKDGNIMTIPREDIDGKNCIRIYCEVTQYSKPSLDDVVATIHKIFSPFTFSWDEINWFTIYPVSQRIASAFDVKRRIFLAGDAAHIHSPKGGLGMNTSLMDAHNLAFKLALVQNGLATPEILSTYSLERRKVAMQLVKMDAELIRIHAEHKPGKDLNSELIAFQREHYAYHAGTNITYQESTLIDAVPHAPSLMAELVGGEGLIVGRRLLPATVKRCSDGKPTKILDTVPFDGRFTIFICLGDLSAPARVDDFEALHQIVYRPSGLWERLETKDPGLGAALFRIIGITTAAHLSPAFTAVVHENIKPPMSPPTAISTPAHQALFDTGSLYTDDIPCLSPYTDRSKTSSTTIASTDAVVASAAVGILLNPLHQKWDISPETGGIVVLRPDGHVGTLARSLNADGWMIAEQYFRKFLVL